MREGIWGTLTLSLVIACAPLVGGCMQKSKECRAVATLIASDDATMDSLDTSKDPHNALASLATEESKLADNLDALKVRSKPLDGYVGAYSAWARGFAKDAASGAAILEEAAKMDQQQDDAESRRNQAFGELRQICGTRGYWACGQFDDADRPLRLLTDDSTTAQRVAAIEQSVAAVRVVDVPDEMRAGRDKWVKAMQDELTLLKEAASLDAKVETTKAALKAADTKHDAIESQIAGECPAQATKK